MIEKIKVLEAIKKIELLRGGHKKLKPLRSKDVLIELLTKYNFKTVLDVGSGRLSHNGVFKELNKEVHECDMNYKGATYFGNFLEIESEIPDNYYDCIWCSHTLEHQVNPGTFLSLLKKKLKEGGILALTVPPMKHYIVGGHANHWTPGMLLYNLVVAGFDCSKSITWAPSPDKFNGSVESISPYDISVLVPKKDIKWTTKLIKELEEQSSLNFHYSVYKGLLHLSGCGMVVLKKYFPPNIKWAIKFIKKHNGNHVHMDNKGADIQFDGRDVSQNIIE
tara:strand:+ start:265 stop:1098 length:834 start_codon:yes stop_codon:yes gene_type:complete